MIVLLLAFALITWAETAEATVGVTEIPGKDGDGPVTVLYPSSSEAQTLTLLVHARYIDDHNAYGAYAASTALMGLAVVTLVLMTTLQRNRA